MVSCYYEPLTRLLRCVNAGGDCPPLVIGDRGHGEETRRLEERGGPVLGMLQAARYEQARLEVRPGDVLVLSTAAGEEYA